MSPVVAAVWLIAMNLSMPRHDARISTVLFVTAGDARAAPIHRAMLAGDT